MSVEYRVGWEASSNASFRGLSEWMEWDDDEATAEQIEDEMNRGSVPVGLEVVLNACGFGWWVETRPHPGSTR